MASASLRSPGPRAFIEPSLPARRAPEVQLDDFLAGFSAARPLLEAARTVLADLPGVEERITRSQIAWRSAGRVFALAWLPARYLGRRGASLALSLVLPRRDGSERWKQVVSQGRGRWLHHLELHAIAELDEELRGWLSEAWRLAQAPERKG